MLAELIRGLSAWVIPVIIFFILLAAAWRKVKVYEAFVEGASEGFATSLRIMPFLVAMLFAVNIFRASGAMDACAGILAPWLTSLGVPIELLPMIIMRPLSGSGSLGLTTEIFSNYGADSFIGKVASVMLVSTDTTFYILTVYFGAIGVKNPRYSLFTGLLGDLAGVAAAIWICRYIYPITNQL